MTQSVGMRRFRAELAEYAASEEPVAVTKHGRTVGWFIPTPATSREDWGSLLEASAAVEALLAERGVDPEDIVSEFEKLRKAKGEKRKM